MQRVAQISKFLFGALAVLAVWFAGLAMLTVAFEPDVNVNVFGGEDRLLGAFAGSDVRLVSSGPGFIRVRGDKPGFVRQLYAGGAWLVLPGSALGCAKPADGRAMWARTAKPDSASMGTR
jgi:hypothetical protein